MPRAIADSDDESDDVMSIADEGVAETTLLHAHEPVNLETRLEALDGAMETSTGSTERLHQQIQSVERKLFSNSASGEMYETAKESSATPSMQASIKRRHTAALAAEASPSPSNSVKRAKTLKTYSSKARTHPTANGSLQPFADNVDGLKTSQSANFTEHSAADSSAALPSRFIHEDFLNHEPNLMFQGSGSTVADNSSAHQRMLEDARGNGHPLLTTSVVQALNSDPHHSSPFSWTTWNEKGGSSGTQKHSQYAAAGEMASEDPGALPDTSKQQSAEKQTNDLSYTNNNIKQTSKHQCSPTVEIPLTEHRASATLRRSSAGSQASTRGRKRKTDEDDGGADPLHSDDRAIGLPKELYQPRPSRRRATHVIGEPIDYSVRPERAAKMKRLKTTDASVPSSTPDPARSGAARSNGRAISAPTVPDTTPGKEIDTSEDPARNKDTAATGYSQSDGQNVEIANATAASQTSSKDGDADEFLKPPKPSPKKKAGSKAKRSQTTIFEDHVEFVGSERSPNLSQQQASRKSALKVINNDASTSRRKRKPVVSDDDDANDDEVDALGKEPKGDNEEKSSPKKRGRGRPAKTKAQPLLKSAELVLEDSDSDDNDQPDLRDSPKNKGVGRPSKTTSEAPSNHSAESEASEPQPHNHSQSLLENNAAGIQKESHPVGTSLTPNVESRATKMPTPSPEQENPPAKPSPTSHSPIKGSSKVPLRVGLSKRQRIPSLLRVMRPLKR